MKIGQNQCAKLPATDKSSIDHIDFVLSSIAKEESGGDIAYEWLDQYLANRSDEELALSLPDLFDSTIANLVNHCPNTLRKMITEWLVHDKMRYQNAVHNIGSWLTVRKATTLSYDPVLVSNMDNDDLMLLVRRTFGWIYDASLRISMTWSLLEADDAPNHTYNHVFSVFQELLGYDYPEDCREFINEKKEQAGDSKQLQDFCETILTAIDSYYDALKANKRVEEFKPERSRLQLFNKARNKEMNDSMEEANKESVLLNLVTQLPVKAGTGTIYNKGGEYSEKTTFSEYGVTMTLPRREAIDKVGSLRRQYGFRSSKRGDK